jgi:hypothetical protein
MIGQASGHSWCHRLPRLGRSVAAFGWHRVGEALPQTAVRENEMGVRKREHTLVCQGVWIFRDGIDLPSHPPCVLASCQIVPLHSIRIARVADRRSLQGCFALLGGPLNHAGRDVDHPTVGSFFHDDRVAYIGRRVTARFGHTSTCPSPWRETPHALHLQEGSGGGGQGGAREERQGPIGRRWQPQHEPAGGL